MREGEPSSEIVRSEGRWTAQDLRAYLLALAHNSQERGYCLEYNRFPREIALSSIWHETFDQMRALTALHHREYWSMIGVTQRREKIVLLVRSVPGEASLVSSEAMASALSEAERRGVRHLVGDIHTHPARFMEKWLGNQDAFSIGDLYGLAYSRLAPAVKFLVGPNLNMAAFRSQESEAVPSYLNQQRFEQFWDRRHYIRLRMGDSLGVNCAIAQQYHLVYYRGRPGQPLVRIFP